ncbi:MAG TPA: OsmC family protein [Gemmatimonadaceae bacterium]|nr:OsmC family protein [Gemmatimonadaceae bacterium]
MAEHRALVRWRHAGGPFLERKYSREHSWTFDGGHTVPASASPSNVPLPFANPANVDPEEAYVAAISSCHMLTFLFAAANAGFDVLAYEDDAVGHVTRDERGTAWVSRVELSPRITYAEGAAPSREREAELHHLAHEQCFIANSVRTEISVRGIPSAHAATPTRAP